MIKFKRILSLLIAGVTICTGLTACGDASESSNRTNIKKESVATVFEDYSADNSNQDSSNTELDEENLVSADYLDNMKDQYHNYVNATESMKVDSSDYEAVILFYAEEDVEDFRVFSLDNNIDEDGNANYIPTEVYRSTNLKKDAPVAVPLNFPGDMSLNGFCYRGSDGTLHTFTVGISGKDGSIVTNADTFIIP